MERDSVPVIGPQVRRRLILSKLVAVAAVLVLVVAGFAGHSELKFRKLSEALDAEIATYKRQRWNRPALRGQAGDGNAAFDALQALSSLPGLSAEQRDGLASHVHYGSPLTRELTALLQKLAPPIAKLRAATLLSWAMTEVPLEPGDALTVPSYPRVMDAALLALAHGAHTGADECLLACADIVRLGQDLVPGAPLEAASVSARLASVQSPLLARCASQASPEALFRAGREFHVLATHPPPTGGSIELADLLTKVKLRRLAQLLDGGDGESALTRLRRRPALLDAFAYFENPARWRQLTADRYPQALETWLHELDWRSRSDLPLVADASSDVDGWLNDDMRGQALVRLLAVGLATLSERLRRERMPREPMNLNEAALRDPFNGQPFKWRIAQDGSELSLWSVGEDRRDDKGSSEWAAQAPIDVVVHFKLVPIEKLEAVKPRRKAALNDAPTGPAAGATSAAPPR